MNKRKSTESQLGVEACQICSKKFSDPHLLPCGHKFCRECNQGSSYLVCIVCRKKHTVSDDCLAIYDRLEECLGQLGDNARELRDKLKHGVATIQEHCAKIRNQIDLQTEIRIEQLQQLRDTIKKNVDQYEVSCIEAFERAPLVQIEQANQILNNAEKFSQKSNVEKDKDQLKLLDQELNEHEESLKYIESVFLKRALECEFAPNEEKLDDVIGKLSAEFYLARLLQQNSLPSEQPESCLLKSSPTVKINPYFFRPAGKFHKSQLTRFDCHKNPIKSVSISLKSEERRLMIFDYYHCHQIKWTATDKSLFFSLPTCSTDHRNPERQEERIIKINESQYVLQPGTRSMIVKTSHNFDVLQSFESHKKIRQLASNYSRVFVKFDGNDWITMFDHQLEALPSTLYAINDKFIDMAATKNKIFVLEKHQDPDSSIIKVHEIDNDGHKVSRVRSIKQSLRFQSIRCLDSDFVLLSIPSETGDDLMWLRVCKQGQKLSKVVDFPIRTNDYTDIVDELGYWKIRPFLAFYSRICN